jgi:2-polyprenyl-3-methyl-5-hydroxy-6-metoxy-1,4-benzoquinol methylase
MVDKHYSDTQDFFNNVAIEKQGFYDSKGKLKHSFFQRLVRKEAIKLFSNTKNNLDLGCGNGDFTNELSIKFPNSNFKGFDFSKDAINLAKTNYPNLNFEVDNLADFKEKFDTIFCINTLHHLKLEDQTKALLNISKNTNNLILEIKNNTSHYYNFYRTGAGNYFPTVDNKIQVYPTTKNRVKEILKKQNFKLTKTIPNFPLSLISPILILKFKRQRL